MYFALKFIIFVIYVTDLVVEQAFDAYVLNVGPILTLYNLRVTSLLL